MTFPICATIILPVRFFQPWWLLATVAAIVPLLLARRARRRGRHIATLSVIVQCLAVLAAGAALGRPRIGLSERAARATMILRDTSASTRGQMDILLNLPAEMPCREVHFAETIFRPGRVRRGGSEATRAGPALRLAAAQSDDIAGVVILTDGQFQDTDWPAAAAALGRTGAAVAVVPAESPPPDARIADFSACLAADGAAELKVTVRSNAMQRRTLTIARRNRQAAVLLTRTLEMPAGDAATIRIQDRPPADRAAVYEARLQEPDTFAENDAAVAVVLPARRRVALVSRRNDSLAKQLARNTSLPVEQVSPADLAGRQFRWLDYAAVVEVDSTGMLLSAQQRAGLAEYVRSGGGLVLIGAGPYETYAHRDDPLNRIAALVANPHERRPLKLAVVLDASGSMVRPARSGDGQAGRRARFDIAAEAVSALQRHLTPADALAVIAFSDCAKVVYDSGASRPDFAALRDALARIQPGGPTRVADALRLATDQSPPAGADGLVLLLSDLLTETFDPAPMAERFRLAGYSMAVVATGAGGEPTQQAAPLETLAGLLDAPMVRKEHLAGLAEVFAQLLRTARGQAIRRGRFSVAATGTAFGIEPARLPDLEAYIVSAARPGAEVLAGTDGDPLLARRRSGLGRSVALAVPLEPGENTAWRHAPRVRTMLTGAVRWVLRAGDDPRFTGRLGVVAGRLRLRIEARDEAGPMNLLGLTVLTTGQADDAETRRVPLRQVAPGRYETDLPAAETMNLSVRDGNGRTVWQHAMGSRPKREFAAIGANWANLRRLADISGGRIVSPDELTTLGEQWNRRRLTPIWPYVLAAALAMMLLEWLLTGVRRGGK